MASVIDDWFRRKLGHGVTPLSVTATVGYEYELVVGPKSLYGKVRLSVSPNHAFLFESKALWPQENWDDWVVDGILDALVGSDYQPFLAARFVLLEIGWHAVNSAPIAYYRAAKRAVRSLLDGLKQ